LETLLSYLFFPVPVPQGKMNAFYIESWQQIELSMALMFPVAFLSGILFPAILTCVQREVASRMTSAGLTILFNTIGAAVGPLLAARKSIGSRKALNR
jgi:fucose permease